MGRRTTAAPIVEAAALGQIEFYLAKPVWSPDEQFHRAVTEALEEWWRLKSARFEVVTVIAKDHTARAHEIRDILTRTSVPFGFHGTDSAEGTTLLEQLGLPPATGPVVALYDGTVLVDPTNAQVAAALGVDTRPRERPYDVTVVGGGPAGLAAAVYGASEGLRIALLEREAFGGQAGTSSLIRNYLGFPRGISGVELAGRAAEQAWLFGAHFIYGNPATSLATDRDTRIVTLQDGSQVRSRAVIIATGMSYRRLDVPELESLHGAGVFYGAATVEAPAMAGKRAFVVGGGNSAGQAALHLSKYAEEVTILPRRLPRREYVRLPDSGNRQRSECNRAHRCRSHRRRRRWTTAIPAIARPALRRRAIKGRRRRVHLDRRPTVHPVATRGGALRRVGLHPQRPQPRAVRRRRTIPIVAGNRSVRRR